MRIARQVWSMVEQVFREWSADKGWRLGAALSYYTVFSMAPLLLLVISLAGLVFGKAAAEGRIFAELTGLLGNDTASLIQTAVTKVNQSRGGALGGVLRTVALVAGATGVVVELQDALDTIWKLAPRPHRGLRGLLRTRVLSVAMIIALGFLLLVSLAVSAALSAFGGWLHEIIGNAVALGWLLDTLIALAVTAMLVALIFKILPSAKVRWRDVWVGASATALLFLVGKYLVGVYIGKTGVASAFGAAGSLVVLLIWVYYSAQIVLLGAEFTRLYANRFGAKVRPRRESVLAGPAVDPAPLPPEASPRRV